MNETIAKIFENVTRGDRAGVEQNVQKAIEDGIPAQEILNEGLIAAMSEVGVRFEQGDFFVPEMLIAARAMQVGLGVLKPKLVEQGVKAASKIVLGTVKGDLHDIGKNLVAMMLEGAGFDVVDLGTDVPPEKFLAAVNEHQPNLVGMSALLTTTMAYMKTTITALEEGGVRENVKIIIGGAPVTETYAQQIGADGYAADASRAVALAKALESSWTVLSSQ